MATGVLPRLSGKSGSYAFAPRRDERWAYHRDVGERARVMIIDDSATAIDVVSAALEGAGFEVHGFTSIFDAPSRVDQLKPALIIVDLMMPALGGDKVIDVLRRHSDHRCPVLLHSSAEESELRQRAEACGAQAWVRKSRDLGALVRTVQLHARAAR